MRRQDVTARVSPNSLATAVPFCAFQSPAKAGGGRDCSLYFMALYHHLLHSAQWSVTAPYAA